VAGLHRIEKGGDMPMIKKTKGGRKKGSADFSTLLPDTAENFYEVAWEARARLHFAAAAKEGRGNLYRTLKVFERLDRQAVIEASRVRLVGDTQSVTRLTGSYVVHPSAPPERDPVKVITEPKTVLENERAHATFAALDYEALPQAWLSRMAMDGFDTVAELGAGYGRNLFEIYSRGGPACRYIGAEYTRSGRDLMKRFAKLDSGMRLETAFFDHRNPNVSFLRKAKKLLLFSCHSIEQVREIPGEYFEILATAAPQVVGVHFEPCGFQFSPESEIARRHEQFVRRRGYNLNLAPALQAAAKNRRISIRFVALNVINPQPENPTSIVVWDNKRP
jgi:hypothetical protein